MHGIETLKNRILKKEKIVGTSVRTWSTQDDIEAAMSIVDYDFLAVDAQHSPFSEHDLVNVCDIANNMGIPIQLRIKHAQFTFLIGNLLDLGPSMIEIPQVEELATVRDAVDNFYYPQKGRRSWGPARSPQTHEYPDRITYAAWWNSHGILWMQIESLSAIMRAREMADLGADVLSWGPNDLTFNREAHPDHPLQTDDDCIKQVITSLEGTETTLCLRTYSEEQMAKYSEFGATMFLDESNLFKEIK